MMMRRLVWGCIASVALIACSEPPATEPVARGRQVYRALDCGRCHHIAGEGGRIAPELTHIGTLASQRGAGTAEAYIRASIVEPGAYIVPGQTDTMPRGLSRGLSAGDLDALVTYLASLK